MRYAGFVAGAYRSRSVNADDEKLVNWYPEVLESNGGKAPIVYYPCPGRKPWLNLTGGNLRGLFAQDGRAFAVGGDTFYEMTSSPAAVSHGTIANDGLPTSMFSNGQGGHQVMLVSGGLGYIFDLNTNTLTKIADADLLGNLTVGLFSDSYFIVLDGVTSTFQISAPEDGTSWSGLDVAQRSDSSDNIVALAVLHRELWVFGSLTTEVWYDSGATFPFQPFPGRLLEQGLAAVYSLTLLDNTLFFIGGDRRGARVVYRIEGDTPQRVSTHAIERALDSYDTVSDAVGYAYQEEGHLFYVLQFPSANVTWVYDVATKLWHQRGVWNTNRADFDMVFGAFHCYAFGQHLVGDISTGQIAIQGLDIVTEIDGSEIPRVRRAPHLCNEQMWQYYNQFQLDVETGLGVSSGQGSNPVVALRWSDDGGHVFGPWVNATAGKGGQYRQRLVWNRLGRSRDRVFEIMVSDPIPWRVLDAYLQVKPGLF